MAEKKPQPKNPADFKEAIKATKSKKGLETLRRQAAEQGKSPETEKIIAAINAKINSIRETGTTRKKKALEKGGIAAAKDVETINEKAETAATEVKEDADKKAAATEHGTESKEGAGKFGKDYVAPELSEDKRTTITSAIESGTDGEETAPENEIIIIGPDELEDDKSTTTTTASTATSTTSSTTTPPAATTPASPGTTPGSTPTTEPVGLENPEDPEANEPKNLEEARALFFAAYGEVEKNTSRFSKALRFVIGADKKEGLDSSVSLKLQGKYYSTQEKYQKFLAQEAAQMLNEGKSKAEVEAMIYSELQAKQESFTRSPLVPERVRNILVKGAQHYSRMPKPARMVTSTLLMTGIFVAAGKVGIAGAGAYAATRLTKAAAGGLVGQALVSLKNKFWNAEKDIEKVAAKAAAESSAAIVDGNAFSIAEIHKLEDIYQNRLRQEQNARIKHLAVDFGIRLLAGLGTGAALDKAGVTGWMDNKLGGGTHHDTDPDKGGKKGGITPPKPPHPEPAPTPVPKPEDQYTFKEIKVEYSSKGSIDTWAQVKSQLKEAYKGVDASKIPPEYKHIMEARADALAKEFGEWRPDATDGKESLNMLKGSSIEFDKSGKIISHSLRTAAGGAEDQTLMDTYGAGKDFEMSQQENERFFHYGGQASADNTVQAPFQDGNAGPTGIGDQVKAPFGSTDSNGFWNQSGAPKPFESHASVPSNGDDTPGDWREETAWDGKRHSKLWWKHHPDGHDYKAEARLAKKLAKQAAAAQMIQSAPYYPPYNASDQIDRAFYQTAVNSGGHSEFYPIGNPANPGGAPLEYQHHEVYGAHLSGQQVDRILNNPVPFIGEDFLARAAHDPAYPLYKVMHDLQQHGYGFRPNESVAEYFARAQTENQAYFAGLNVDVQDWFVRNGFYR